ncbi:DUF6463 family protein [Streptomyces sp. NBC_00237]|uniref:DUF6463 family protein n=1 Tax=Streptomyces sp. NBC_00237 TaxID=2975687 RepID=UPI002250147B|nr:DUF6463 family protein [Streptomyces sp. NBC_00237]MCX5204986.1 DUF6463 family protein [Streptomyces sp. NBC_00237]
MAASSTTSTPETTDTSSTTKASTPGLPHPKLTRTAGWIAAAFGLVHIAVAPIGNADDWAAIFQQGPWNTLSLDVTAENLRYSNAFWVSPGSFGVPMLLVGAFILWAAKRGQRVPAGFGWTMTVWGALLSALLPASPAWALLAVGALLLLAARHNAPTTKAS